MAGRVIDVTDTGSFLLARFLDGAGLRNWPAARYWVKLNSEDPSANYTEDASVLQADGLPGSIWWLAKIKAVAGQDRGPEA
jgi:hypothetical protein